LIESGLFAHAVCSFLIFGTPVGKAAAYGVAVSERSERTLRRRRDRLAERGGHVVGVGSRSEATP
jgi:hypothetical protein